jgi:hypothetical protein
VPFKDAEERRKYQREYARSRYGPEQNAKNKAWRKEHRDKCNAYARKCKYGLSADEFSAMLVGQGGACAICHKGLVEKNVDHSHASGRVRGILCNKCNLALGMADDSPDRLRAMAEYIERSEE